MKGINLSYMAGFFDGEGCICIGKSPHGISLICSITQCNEWILQLFKMRFGGTVRLRQPYKAEKYRTFSWNISGGKAGIFLGIIKPYLMLKRAEAELAIQFQMSKGRIGHHLTDNQKAVEEAQRILMQKLKMEGKINA